MVATLPIGEFLLRKELVAPRILAAALKEQPTKRLRLISMLILRAELEIDDGALALSEQLGYPAALERHLDKRDLAAAKLLPPSLCAQYGVIAIGKTAGGRLIVGARDPSPALVVQIETVAQVSVELAVMPALLVERLVRATFNLAVEPTAELPGGIIGNHRARSVSALYRETTPPGVPGPVRSDPTPAPTLRQPPPKVVIPERKSGPNPAVSVDPSADPSGPHASVDETAPILLDKPKKPSGAHAPVIAVTPPKEPSRERSREPSKQPPKESLLVTRPGVGPAERVPAEPLAIPVGQRPTVESPVAALRPSKPPPPPEGLDQETVVPTGSTAPGPAKPLTTQPAPTTLPAQPRIAPLAPPKLRPPPTPPMPSRPPDRPSAPPATPLRMTQPGVVPQPLTPSLRDTQPGLPDIAISRDDTQRGLGTVGMLPAPSVPSRPQKLTTPAPNAPLPAEARPPSRQQSPTRPAPNMRVPDEARSPDDEPEMMVEFPVRLPTEPPAIDASALPAPTRLAERPLERARSVSEMFDDLLDEPPVSIAPPLPEPSKKPEPAALPEHSFAGLDEPVTPPAPLPHSPPTPPTPLPPSIRAVTEPSVVTTPLKPPPPPGTGSIDAIGKEIERAISRATADRVLITFAGSRFKTALLVMIVDGVARGARGQGPRLQAVQTIVVPIEAASTIQTAHDSRELTREVPSSPTQDRLAEWMGTSAPLAAPIIVDDKVVAVLVVGDPSDTPVADADLVRVIAAFATAYRRLYKSK